MSEIMCSTDDINSHLDLDVFEATDDNTELIQESTARLIRGYLSTSVDRVSLASWSTPDACPDIIREAASLFCASQFYANQVARSTTQLDNTSYAQVLYDRAMLLLNGIVNGDIVLVDPITGTEVGAGIEGINDMSVEDFFPIDDTDRAFRVGMEL